MPFEVFLIAVLATFGAPLGMTWMILNYLKAKRTMQSVSKQELQALREQLADLQNTMDERFADLTLMLHESKERALPENLPPRRD